MENKKCKKCNKELPMGYKHSKCEFCRNQDANNAAKIIKGVAAVGGTIGAVAITIITKGKINPGGKS